MPNLIFIYIYIIIFFSWYDIKYFPTRWIFPKDLDFVADGYLTLSLFQIEAPCNYILQYTGFFISVHIRYTYLYIKNKPKAATANNNVPKPADQSTSTNLALKGSDEKF